MINLCMDSAYKHLVIGLYKDNELIDGVSFEAFKKQSETIFVELNQLLKKTGLDYKDIDRIVITDGPGSYTGIRIAMTIAKVLASQMKKELCCISTMQLYAGLDDSANVILDARSKRAYVAHVEKGNIVGDTKILTVEELPQFLKENPGTLYGDGYLLGMEAHENNFLKNFIDVQDQYRKIDSIHALVPQYLKESDSYKV
ncbi:MAG: tRNA (adenosine(37)-N6)-threonylcarbamoyltransferase complex dimerization subunit type 1 TsaB [Holdemanella sp.]|nr:tRNA (adenosine(37)-N6)-threonylcarbamoyltransferase complex dimerization subunit type 1 TsaB [Holdemanella sp.]